MHLIYVVEYPDNKYIVFRTKREVVVGSQLNSGEVVDVIKSDDQMDVDKITKKYMMEYGIKNVQGGSYYNLKDCQIKALEHEFESLKAIVKPSEYLNKFTSIKEIDYEITFLKKILNQIIDLENCAEESKKNILSQNIDLNEYVNQIKKFKELHKELHNVLPKTFDRNQRILMEAEKKNLHELWNMFNTRRSITKIHSNRNNFNFCSPISETENIKIQLLQVINFELEVKNELKKLHKKYINKETIEINITELYKKRIEMLEKQLESNENVSSNEHLSSDDDTTTHSTGFSTDLEESTDEDI